MGRTFIYKIIIIHIFFNILFGQTSNQAPDNLFANMSFVIAVPQGEFSDNVSNNGYGGDFDFGWFVYNGPIAVGLNILVAQYGNAKREIPYSYFSSLVTLTESTRSDIIIINPYVQPTLRIGDVNFYAKFFGGLQILSTDTKITNDDQENNWNNSNDDDDEPGYIAKSNVATDFAFNIGAGFGFRFPIFRSKDSGPLFASLELKWSNGGNAEYLNASKDGSIALSDPSDGPVTTTLYPDESKTNLFNISIGIGF